MSTGGQAVGGIVGGIIGFVASGYNPSGALYGAQLGMMAGGYLDPPKGAKTSGPRLSDLRVQTSTLGVLIPREYSKTAIVGNVFWVQGDKLTEVIVKKKVKTGGKGGGSKATREEPQYFATFAVALCEGVIDGIDRIWIGPDLYYSPNSTDPDTIIASNAAEATFALYKGTNTQMPDPRMQADKGAANVSAHRGLAYIVFYDLPLARYGNSLQGAIVKVEVVQKGNVPADYNYASGYAAYGFTVSSPQIAFGAGLFCLFQHASSTTYYTSTIGVAWTARTRPSTAMAGLAFCKDRFIAGAANAFYTSSDAINWSASLTTGYSGNVNQWAANSSHYVALLASGPTVIYSTDASTWAAATLPGLTPYTSIAWNGSIWVAINSASGEIATSSNLTSWTSVATVSTGWSQLATKGSEFVAKKSSAAAVVLHSADGVTWTEYATPYGTNVISMISVGDEVLFIDSHSELYSSGIGETTWELELSSMGSWSSAWRGIAWNGVDRLITTKATVDDKYIISRTLGVPGSSGVTTLAEIVSAECLKTKILTAGDIDVTSLTENVRGYLIGSFGTLRSALEPLQGAWPFDIVQAGYKIKFVLRKTNASVLTVPEADLGAYKIGDNAPPRLQTTRELDTLLPKRISIQYLDAVREYQGNYQYAERLNTVAINNVAFELPIVLTDAEAAGIAQTLLYVHWVERQVLEFNLPPSYLALEASDVIGITTPEGVISVRLTSVEVSSAGLLKCVGRPFSQITYTPVATGASGSAVGMTTISPIGKSKYHLLDVPRMGSAQNEPSFLVAMAGERDNWRGGFLMNSTDAGASWGSLQGFDAPGAAFGVCANSIGVVDSRTIDFSSQLTVTLIQNALFSVSQLSMLSGENYFAYGANGRWEIIAAQNCDLTTGKTYVLSNLLRGRFGTEWAMGLHVVGDVLVLLDPSEVVAIEVGSGNIGLFSLYRGITVDQLITSDTDLAFTYRGVNLRPLPPVYLTGSRDASGNWLLGWIRRTRKGGEWRDYVDVELGEAFEQYQIDIFASGAYAVVKRTITVTTATCAYSSVDQIADFGANQATLYLKIYQMSATVGRGYALTQSITR